MICNDQFHAAIVLIVAMLIVVVLCEFGCGFVFLPAVFLVFFAGVFFVLIGVVTLIFLRGVL